MEIASIQFKAHGTIICRDTYERIIPNHLADIQKYPKQILKCFEEGGFTVNINGERWHAVALDEAHEMCVNEDLKSAVIHPTTSYLQKTTLFFNYRIKTPKNIVHQLFPERTNKYIQSNTILDSTKQAGQRQCNILKMCSEIRKYELVSTDDLGN